jgi:hypothetical protein
MSCPHLHVIAEACDQTLGVVCTDCNTFIALCWGDDRHIPETLWNRVCDADPECKRCEQNRENFCALCEEEVSASEV